MEYSLSAVSLLSDDFQVYADLVQTMAGRDATPDATEPLPIAQYFSGFRVGSRRVGHVDLYQVFHRLFFEGIVGGLYGGQVRHGIEEFCGRESLRLHHAYHVNGTRWCEVNMKVRTTSEPGFCRERLMRAIVVHHQRRIRMKTARWLEMVPTLLNRFSPTHVARRWVNRWTSLCRRTCADIIGTAIGE
jgi:hypothetical protein